MAFSNRQFNRGEKPHSVFANNKGSAEFNKYFYVRLGVIKEIDYDKYEMIITWQNQVGTRTTIPISFPYAGPAGCLGMVPEIGAVGIFGFFDEGKGKGSPLLLSYLPSGLANGLDFNNVKTLPDSISTDEKNIIQHRFRKIMEGDMIMSSPLGGQILVNKGLELIDEMKDSIFIRGSDQSIISTALNNFIFSDGVSVRQGQIIRNGLMLYDLKGNKIKGLNGSPLSMPGGRSDNVYIVPFGEAVVYDSEYYVEHRIDVDEKGDGKLDMNDINSLDGISIRDPIVSQVLGNYVGNNKADEKTYGKILKPQIFLRPDDLVGSFNLLATNQFNGMDEPAILGLAYALHFHKNGVFFGVDKEGHYYVNLGSSISNPIGSGRSMSLNAPGSLKEVWGPANSDNNSWDLTTKGGIRWNVGAHNQSGEKRSIQISASSGIQIEANGADDQGNAMQETYFGNAIEVVAGSKTVEVTETYDLLVKGMKVENIYGSSSESYQVDKTVNVTGVYSEIVVKEKQQKYGKRKTTITVGSDDLTVLAGNIFETIATFGNKTSSITTGNSSELIIAGNKTTAITTGNYSVTVGAGNITVATAAGVVSIAATGSINITSASMVNVTAPMVNLGAAAVGGVVVGIPGIPSHLDYLTGMPLKSSMTVKAAL
jgi:hypothetical protein